MVSLKFNTADHPVKDFGDIPDGDYPAIIQKFEEKQSQAGHTYLSATFQIIDGQYSNRLVWENFNLSHPNPETRQISEGKLSSLCLAVGLTEIEDTEDLVGEEFVLRIKSKGDKTYNTFKPKAGKNKLKGSVDKSGLRQKIGVPSPSDRVKADAVKKEAAAKASGETTVDDDNMPW